MLKLPPFTILTFSSPSGISSSAMPDSCTRSISFFSFRRSMVCPSEAGPVGFGAEYRGALAPALVVGLRRAVERELQRGVVAAATETADHAHSQVRKVRAVAKSLSGMDVGQMHLDKRYGDPGEGVSQGDARMRVTRRVDDDVIDSFRLPLLHPVYQLAFQMALEAEYCCASRPTGSAEPRLDCLPGPASLD